MSKWIVPILHLAMALRAHMTSDFDRAKTCVVTFPSRCAPTCELCTYLESSWDKQWCCRAEKKGCIFMIAIPAVTCYLFPPFRGALWRKLLACVCLLASVGLFLLAWICLLMFACVCLLAASAGLFVLACFCLLVFACVCLLAFSCLFLLACFCLLASACCYYGTWV